MNALARPKFSPAGYLIPLGILAILYWSYRGVGADFGLLLSEEGRRQILDYIWNLFPPDLSAAFLNQAARASLETVAISFLGTIFAAGLALGLVFFATRTLFLSEGGPLSFPIFLIARAILNLSRSVPEIVWALIFILAVGLGPFPGVLALAVHTGGVLGKLYAEVLENVEPEPIEALAAGGAGRLQILFYGVLPQALPQFISFTLYRWEVNIRAATILGFVGAGGLGQQLYVALNLFLYSKLLTLIAIIFIMVTAVDYLSALVRRRFI